METFLNTAFNIQTDKAQETTNLSKSHLINGKYAYIKIDKQDIEDEYQEISISDDDSISDVFPAYNKCSAVQGGLIPSIIGKIADALDGDTKDGQISATQQHSTGDCWLLSGINALSYSEEGKELIKDCLEYRDGFTFVHLKGIGSYPVKDEELEIVKSQIFGSKQYSTGDDDMLIFELAIEKALDDIANGNIALDPNAPWWMEGQDDLNATKQSGESSTEGGWGLELLYFVTGKAGKRYSSKEGMEKALLEYEKDNNKNMVMTASAHEKGYALDVNGNEVKIGAPHAYAIKEVKNGIITLTNPWDSGKDIQFTVETFLETFSDVETVDLSDDSSKKNFISKVYKFDENGDKIFIFQDEETDGSTNTREVKYSSSGKPAQIITKKGSHLVSKETYDLQGTLTEKITYGKAGIAKMNYDPKTDEIRYSISINLCEPNDKKHAAKISLNEEEYKKVISSNILDYKQFSNKDIKNLLKLSNEDWSKAMKYLKDNPTVSYQDIENYLNKYKNTSFKQAAF